MGLSTPDWKERRRGFAINEPKLLDTSTLQHLRFVSESLDGSFLTDELADEFIQRFGQTLGRELVALGDILSVKRDGPAWLASETSLIEFARTNGEKGRLLLNWWWEWADFQHGCFDADWYPEVDPTSLAVPCGPEVSEHQLSLKIDSGRPWPESVPPFGPFRDAGDRAVIRDAQRAGIPGILTTDIGSFWRHRDYVGQLGIEVFRPTELAARMGAVVA